MIVHIIEAVYRFLWGDLFTLKFGAFSMGISLLVLLLIPTGIYFTFRTNFVSVRLFPDMVRSLSEKKGNDSSLSPLQTLFVSTATRVGMGNLVGVVAAVSAGGAGAVFWMWLTAILGSATAFIEQHWPRSIRIKILCTAVITRTCILYPLLCRKNAWTKTASFCNCCFICLFRPVMLVRHQPGDQQLRCLCL